MEMAFEQANVVTGNSDLLRPCDDKVAESLFRKQLRKFESVRNMSSPVFKLITIHRVMNEFMAAFNGAANSGPFEADNLICIVFYIIVSL